MTRWQVWFFGEDGDDPALQGVFETLERASRYKDRLEDEGLEGIVIERVQGREAGHELR